MVSIIDILIYFGYDNPWQVYQSINQDILIDLIRRYYEENPL